MDSQNPAEAMRLKGVSELFKESWQIYRSKIKTLLEIMAVLVGFNIFSEILINYLNNTDIKYSVIFSAVLAITSLVSLFLWFLSIPSLLFAIKEDIGLKESYAKSLKIIISYTWVYFLFGALIIGGFILSVIPGFLLSIIISIIFYLTSQAQILSDSTGSFVLVGAISAIFGVLFLIRFSLAVFTLVFEEKKGMNAILKSKFLVSGKFWGVLARFLALGIITCVLPLLILILIDKIDLGGTKEILRALVNYSLEFFTVPFTLIYGYLVYNNLDEIKRGIPYQEPFLLGKLKYALPGILGMLVIGFMVMIWSLNIIWGRDEMPSDDSDLMLTKVEIANQEDNAFYWLAPYMGFNKRSPNEQEFILKNWPEGKEKLKETKNIYWPKDQNKMRLVDDIINGKTWDEGFVKELLENNQGLSADFNKAANSTYFQDPILRNPENINPFTAWLSVSEFRNIAKLNLIKSVYLFNQGQEKEAFDEAVKVIRFGNLMKNSQGTLMNYLIATSIKEMGLNQIRVMLSNTNLPSEELRNYIGQLEELKDNGQSLAKAMKGGYISYNYYKKIVDMVYTGKVSKKQLPDEGLGYDQALFQEFGLGSDLPFSAVELTSQTSYLYKPNQTQRLFAEDARVRVINASKKYCGEMNFDEERIYFISSQTNSLGPAMIFTENPIGNILYSISATSLSGTFIKKCNEDFSITGTETLMALKAYKIEKGDLPASLSDLVPAYLSEVPRDSFDGKPIRYSREKKIIYSVGQDLKDSDGYKNTEYGEKSMDDISFEINF